MLALALPEPVSIIGASGALGFGLAVRLARAGCAVTVGSRDAQRAEQTAIRAREAVPDSLVAGFANAEAAARNELVILCVPFRNQSETLHNLRDALRPGQLLVDCTVPLAAAVGGKAMRTVGVWQGSAAQQAQEMVPEGVTVVSALHTVSAALLRDLGHDARRGRPALRRQARRQAPRGGRSSTRSTACAASTPGGWRWRASSSR